MPRPLSKIWTISKEEFLNIVKRNKCIRDIVKDLGFIPTSGSMALVVKKRIKRDGIDTSHLIGRKAKNTTAKYTLDEILVENSTYSNLTCLKTRLVRDNLMKYECSECGNTGIYNNKPLVLQLDHINGIYNDHRLENLRLLCPNCHAQTSNYCGKNCNKNT